jgi:hypothetical protein
MENISVIKRTDTAEEINIRRSAILRETKPELSKRDHIKGQLTEEVDENFLNYLNIHGLADEDNLLVLSSKLHYYYDYEELKDVTTLINLKKLNLIKHLDDFLQTLYNGLSPKTNFIGCFADWKVQKGVSVISRYYRKFINFLDARRDIEINNKDFSKLLESHGFKIIDMTEINGLTYFRTQNFRMATVNNS